MSSTAWLRSRLALLYAHPTTGEHDVTPAVQDTLLLLGDEFKKEASLGGEMASIRSGNVADLAGELQVVLTRFTGLQSIEGRIARMELAHAIEGLRMVAVLLDPEAEIDAQSLVPINQPVNVDPARSSTYTNNISAESSTTLPAKTEPELPADPVMLDPGNPAADPGPVADPGQVVEAAGTPTAEPSQHPDSEPEPAEPVVVDPAATPLPADTIS